MSVYYHYTTKNNADSIIKSKRLNGEVFACDNIKDLSKFLSVYLHLKRFKKEDIRIIAFVPLKDTFTESYDHSPKFFDGAKAYISYKDIKFDTYVVHNFEDIFTYNE